MADDGNRIEISLAPSLSDVDRDSWNAIANPPHLAYDPFLDWDFLEALESSGCVSPEQGWTPNHLLVSDDSNELIGAMPLYLKTHSQGEFIFDHSWADAYMRAGGDYYPKLLSAVPFTPVTGRRRLIKDNPQADALAVAMIEAASSIAEKNGLSSLHINFIDPLEYEKFGALGLLQRQDQQFHWINRGYDSFEHFLEGLSSSKRKNLRKERTKAVEGLRIEKLTGNDLTEEHWDIFYDFYLDTGSRKWGAPYLNREFFSLLHARMADKCLIVLARDEEDSRPIGGALNLIGGDTLYGRYWGCCEHRSMLHFEVCYYQAIDFAIANGLNRVEAGAQGGHKLARGYEPSATYSAHWIAHPGFREAISNYLDMERREIETHIDYLGTRTPFKKRDENH